MLTKLPTRRQAPARQRRALASGMNPIADRFVNYGVWRTSVMPIAALITWFATALVGLYLQVIWLIEYDPELQAEAATRLPVPVISTHVLLALSGLVLWAAYLITEARPVAWAAAAVLTAVVALGLSMALRWVGVHQARIAPAKPTANTDGTAVAAARAGTTTAGTTTAGDSETATLQLAALPERHFPLPVVIAHGIFAAVTVGLVLLTVFGIDG